MTRRTGQGARMNMDNIWIYRAVALIVVGTGLAAIVASWEGLMYVSSWLELPPELRWILPVMIDLPIAGLALGALSLKSIGRPLTASLFTTTAIGFTAASAAANFLHVVSIRGLDDYTDWTGAIAKGLAPAITLVMTEALGALIAKQKTATRRKTRKAAVRRPVRPVAVIEQPTLYGSEERA